ncbi:twin-arginine translocation signal domain-containing protein, partial [Candidatus Bathyarchaeota archaeon]|nr:twin-arginine translocation signal domain-containing protein [Candidatus Bathyarchaeota archaeon]
MLPIQVSRRRLIKMLIGMGAAAIGLGAGSYKLLDYFGERENLIIEGEIIKLPDPKRSSRTSVEEVLDRRRSR